jgi:chromosome segregation ATPase
MTASRFQNKPRLLRHIAMGLFIMGVALPAYAQDLVLSTMNNTLSTLKDTREFSSRDRLIDTFMAEDQAVVDRMNASLEGTTADALDTLDRASRKLHLAELDASGAQKARTNAMAREKRLQSALDNVTHELVGAQETLVTLQEVSSSKDNTVAITNVETELTAEISVLEKAVEKARTRLHTARYRSWRAKNAAKSLESSVKEARDSVDAAQGELHAIRVKIAPKQRSLNKERTSVTALANKLSKEQLLALNRSLDAVLASGLKINLGSYHLRKVLNGHYDEAQISAMTRSLVSAAKYLQLAQRPQPGDRAGQ